MARCATPDVGYPIAQKRPIPQKLTITQEATTPQKPDLGQKVLITKCHMSLSDPGGNQHLQQRSEVNPSTFHVDLRLSRSEDPKFGALLPNERRRDARDAY
jgi:hypothetical protein